MAACKFQLDRKVRPVLHELVEAVDLHHSQLPVWKVWHDGQVHTFKRICQRCAVYRCKSLGIVVKRPNFILASNTPLKVRVPTIKLNGAGWVVQPIVIKSHTSKAVSLIRKELGNFYCDLHHLNVGWYKGKPVLFDW